MAGKTKRAAVKIRKRTNKTTPSKGRLRDFADQLWSLAIKEDWAHKCAVCGTSSTLNSHHLVPRQHEATRYELRNGICLCVAHHQFDNDLSPHQNAAGFIKWLEWHHPELAEWLFEHCRPKFDGTKNAAHYIEVIRSLRQHVEPDDFDRIVGIKFGRHLQMT